MQRCIPVPWPADQHSNWPGLPFAYAINSGIEFTGTDALTAMREVVVATRVTGENSSAIMKRWNIVVPINWDVEATHNV